MHCIDDKPNGIFVNYSPAWSGEARIAWYITEERRDPGPTPPSLRECLCNASDLVAGRFTLLSGDEPPINVLTRAVALAVETFLRRKMEGALDKLFIHRGKL
jgi:hypothetical protein